MGGLTILEKGKRVRRNKRQRQLPIPVPPRQRGEEVEKICGGIGGRCFELCFCFPLSYSNLIGNELNQFL